MVKIKKINFVPLLYYLLLQSIMSCENYNEWISTNLTIDIFSFKISIKTIFNILKRS